MVSVDAATLRFRSGSNASVLSTANSVADPRQMLQKRGGVDSGSLGSRPMTPRSNIGKTSSSQRQASRNRTETRMIQKYQSLVFQNKRMYSDYVRRMEYGDDISPSDLGDLGDRRKGAAGHSGGGTNGGDDYYENEDETLSDKYTPPPDHTKYGKLELTTSFTAPKPPKRKKQKMRHPIVECEGTLSLRITEDIKEGTGNRP